MNQSEQKIIIYTDGASRGNPGSSGVGAVIYGLDGSVIAEVSEYIGEGTNNVAEYQAVIYALKALKRKMGSQKVKTLPIEVRLDSQLVCQQLSEKYQIKEPTLFPLFMTIHNMRIAEMPNLMFVHVPREKNKEADRLANEAIDNKDK